MKEHDWMKLYADAEKFMKKSEALISTSKQT